MRRFAIALLCALIACTPALGQNESIQIRGDRLGGFVLPVEPVAGDITLKAQRASVWTVDDTKRLYLSGDVLIEVAQFRFASEEAAVWIDRIPSADGVINQIAIYFDSVTDPVRTAGMGAIGNRLLVTGSTRGEVNLSVVDLREDRATTRPIVEKGEKRLADYLRTLLVSSPTLAQYPQADAVREDGGGLPELVPGGPPPEVVLETPDEVETPPLDAPSVPMFVPDGFVAVNAGNIEITTGDTENIIYATDSLTVEYTDDRGDGDLTRLSVSAQRGVIFTEPGAISDLPSLGFDAASVIGIYLEGDVVATDGEYMVRGSRIYYDMRRQRAVMIDGVVRTYSRDINRTIYARAEEFRQVARNQWVAERAIVSTSEFFTPHLSIGARNVTITQNPVRDGSNEVQTHIRANNNTLQLAGVPVFWWPYISGNVDNIPLKDLSMAVEDNKGFILKTSWDIFALAGEPAPEGVELLLHADLITDRGFGLGVELEYDIETMRGLVDLYGQSDDGIDKTSAGREVDSEKDFRGVALWEHHMRLSTHTVLQAQASYISDETYVTTWREEDFEDRREYETSLYLRNVDAHVAWTALAKYNINDFLSNDWLIASRAYSVDKLPEFTYRRYGDSIFGDTVTYSTETRASRVGFSMEPHSPDELGIRARGFGIPRTTEFEDVLEASGLLDRFVWRFDTRHELAAPMSWGALRVRPFLVGRFTVWDNEFNEFSSDGDNSRFFGAAGVTVSTSFQRVYNDIESSFFDIHRVRHIVEPSVTLWSSHATVDQSDIPVYDETVESLASGSAVRFGLRNTFQTQRGGPGYWHSVDFLKIDTAIVLASNDTNAEHPVPQYFEFRPEYSNFIDHVSASFIWMFSDTFSFVGEGIVDLEDTRLARGSIGVLIQHSPAFSTYVEYRYIDASDLQLLGVGLNYQISSKYSVSLRPQWDFRRDEFRSLTVQFTREFPDFDLTFGVRHDSVRRDTQFRANVRLHQF